jgi:hypothetical protein
MTYVNPKNNPNEWLAASCKALLDDVTKESNEAVWEIVDTLIDYVEPGLIDQAFAPLIAQYMETLEEYEKMNNSSAQMYLQVNSREVQNESNIAPE